jgi:hypothetical protein
MTSLAETSGNQWKPVETLELKIRKLIPLSFTKQTSEAPTSVANELHQTVEGAPKSQ